jgi:hypothetical protein
MHKENWGKYSDMPDKDGETIFSGQSQLPLANTLDAHIAVDTAALYFGCIRLFSLMSSVECYLTLRSRRRSERRR